MLFALLLSLLSLLPAPPPACGFVPLACVRQLQEAPIPPVRCCPSGCGGPRRGECAPVAPTLLSEREFLGLAPGDPRLRDDRLDWPMAFFSHLCRCHGRFAGVACEDCQPGWRGADCQQRQAPLVRRNLSSLSSSERRRFRQLMLLGRRRGTSRFALLVENGRSGGGSGGSPNITTYGSRSDPLRRPRFITGASLHFYLVHMHFYAQRGTLSVPPDDCTNSYVFFNFNHQGNNFLPWHRHFIAVWERALQRLAARHLSWPDFALPYWDWTDARECGPLVCGEDLFGLASHNSPFRRWRELCAAPVDHKSNCYGCMQTQRRPLTRHWMHRGSFPSRAEVQFAASRPSYYQANDLACQSLVQALEGECGPRGSLSPFYYMHNRLHALVNGSFSSGAASPNDPIFPLHHAQIDRILESWLRKHGHSRAVLELPDLQANHPGHGPESYMVGFLPLVKAKDVLVPTEALGYTYDTLAQP